MDVLLSELQLNIMISIVVFFVSFFVLLYLMRYRSRRPVAFNEYEIEATLSKYMIKLEDYTTLINELRAKMDVLEAKISTHEADTRPMNSIVTNSAVTDIYESVYDEKHVIPNNIVTSQKNITRNRADEINTDKTLRQNTIMYILQLLNESPMTAREIQLSTKKTREHTSRLMKKLYIQSLLTRDIGSKPFLYKITDEGRRLLKVTHSNT